MALWQIPLPYFLLGVIAGIALPRAEYAYFPQFGRVVSVGSAQSYLSAVSSGMITLTALVFSAMFVMMQIAMGSYSKRLFLLFAGHPLGLHAIGVSSATFLSALGTLLFVDRNHDGRVPYLSIEFDTALLVLSMVFLALLVQRAALLRITYILQFVGDKGRSVIARTLPVPRDRDGKEIAELKRQAGELLSKGLSQKLVYEGVPLAIVHFRIDDYVRLAQESGGTIVMRCAIGDTVARGTLLLEVYGTKESIPEATLLKGIKLAHERSFEEDPKYSLRLLVDTALLALSPAVNDPTTAVQAIDQIEDLLNRLGSRVLDAGFIRDARGDLRFLFPMPTWDEYLSLAFDEIRLYGATTMQVLRRMRAALTDLLGALDNSERMEAVTKYLDRLNAGIQRTDFSPADQMLALQADPQGLGHTRPPNV
jgi:uncharacterized membrane protein